MSKIKIRKAEYTDCMKLSKLKKEVWETTYRGLFPDEKIDNYDYEKNEEKFKGFIDNPNQELYVATSENEPIGFIEFGEPNIPFMDFKQEIGLLYIRKDFQQQGIGKQLFSIAMEYIKGTGADKFFLICLKYNFETRKFYEKMGGKIIQIDDDSTNDGMPKVKFEYKIAQIIEYNYNYDEQIKDLLVELQNYLVDIDNWNTQIMHPNYRDENFKLDMNKIQNFNGKIYLAIENDIVVGLIMGIIEEKDEIDKITNDCAKTGSVIELIIKNDNRGNGIGKSLLEKMEEYFKSVDCKRINIEVFGPNKEALNFYEKNGYIVRDMIVSKQI